MPEMFASPPVPRWLRMWAVLTVCAAFPLAVLGAETTTRGVGMADQVSLRTPWYFFTLDLRETSAGLLIEHGHRLFGWTVGICAIVLAMGLQICGTGWRRGLGWVALFMVTAQGIFGILRVRWNALAGPELAALHGCFAQLAFATLVAVAVLVSRTFSHSPNLAAGWTKPAIWLCVLVYVQIIFGALIRHKLDANAQRLHVLLAFVVVLTAFWLTLQLHSSGDGSTRKIATLLLVLLLIQPILGVEAWIRRFGSGVLPELVRPSWGLDFVRSSHHLLGTVIFSTTVALTILLFRPSRTTSMALPTPQPLEGAA